MLPDNMQSISCNKRCIIFDLDESLINTKQRHYLIYKTFLEAANVESLSYKKYLKKRIEGYTNREILAMGNADLESEFAVYWKKSIEDEQYLKYDKLIAEPSLLEELKLQSKMEFILLSLRSNEASAKKQFSNFPFSKLFNQIIFVKHTNLKNPKTEIIKLLKSSYDINFYVGDSMSDYNAAFENDIIFFGVDSGWKPLEILDIYKNINQILKLKINEFRERKA